MQAATEELALEFPAEPESVTAARHAAAKLARSAGADEMDVKIAVSEAVGNAVVHAYPDGDPRSVQMSAAVQDRRLVFVVQDQGVGMRPHPASPGLRLGLPLIGQVTEELQIDAHLGGTRISMSFPVAA